MEIGTEISKKIRAAIKGKLQELGAYIDEELPDYIMVMVANKKTSQQMADDLSLFLGNNTMKFTSWLHGVLEKLRSVAAEPASLKQLQSDSATVSGKRFLTALLQC
ncbi:zinc finger CCCH domain-containing protein 14-like [Neolamprologus brichardi]|uniref:zinc finger CCCH domain-containing protein 14-like n=1 Tax=Neolamprologus brichardi TaxID=32507 RepID=UPI001643EA6E|nr:zinc finger CCCH domain-containing protein 14-like [Neolamprologus brichardi]